MVQFNLLPEVKAAYLKVDRVRRLVIIGSITLSAVVIAAMVGLFGLTIIQKQGLNNINSSISVANSKIAADTNLPKILTVQQQLETLTGLHQQKPAVTWLADYLNKTVPQNVFIDDLTVNFTTDTVSIGGMTDSLQTVNQFVDSLKFTTYSSTGTKTNTNTSAFSGVVLSQFALLSSNSSTGDSVEDSYKASYVITFSYDPEIFNIVDKVTLNVPKDYVTTRSQVDQPTDLFMESPTGDKK